MAEKKVPAQSNIKPSPQLRKGQPKPAEPAKKKFSLFKLLAFLLILLMLSGVGFAGGVYFNFIDMTKLAADHKLYQYPVIGAFFPKPPEPQTAISLADEQPNPQAAAQQVPVAAQTEQPAVKQASTIVNDAEKEKAEKAKQQEETKRISRLARLYGAMKPEEAVPIFNQLDDDMVIAIMSKMEDEQVAKLLALMDNKRAARLTQAMLKGKQL